MSRLRSDDYELYIRQGPERARVAGTKEKDRKPVDPPPIIQLKIRDDSDPQQNYLQSPYYFMCTNLYPASETPKDTGGASSSYNQALAGTLVSSLHRLKDIDNTGSRHEQPADLFVIFLDGGFFVFGDLSVKVEGQFRLRFSLFEISNNEVHYIKSITSNPFTVYPMKNFPGMSESTFLSRSFGDQGVRLRIRKEPRTLVRKRAYRPPPPEAYASAQMRRPSSPDSHYMAHGYPTPHSSVDYGYGPYHDMHKRVKMDGGPQYPPGREPYGERSPYAEYPPNPQSNPPNYHPGYPNYPNPSYQQQRSPTTPGGYFPPPPQSAHSNPSYSHYPPAQHPQHEYPSRHSSYSGPSPVHQAQQPSPLYESPGYHSTSQSARSPATGSAPYKSYDRQTGGPPPTYPPSYPEDAVKQPAYRTTQPQTGSVHSPPGGLPSPGLSRTSGSMASHTSSPMNSSSRGPAMPAQPPSPYKSGFSLPPLQLPPLSEPHGSSLRTQTHTKTPGPPVSFETYAT
ncbi:hypothetical protein DRE_06428 [Drechslerella stenobrocha 248]|uniref:Velvet domain-containing protein n=1 Tax=Drechslerella stenobrocha 248 TaxID=1043628 RepID=W7I744_9PEZI|nr:hypothetical protein DRE_06428 [Drechslerella stenobrocha 248]